MGDTGSFYFGHFRTGQRHGLGLLFVPLNSPRKGHDQSAAAASSSSSCSRGSRASPSAIESFSIHAAIWNKDAVNACWVGIASTVDNPPSAASSKAAAASAAQTSALGPKELLVWQALQRLLRHAVPAVLRLQHHQLSGAAITSAAAATGASAAAGSLSAPSQAAIASSTESALRRLASPAAFRLVSVPNAVYTLSKSSVCSYRVTGELGCAEQPHVCLTCAEAEHSGSMAGAGGQRPCGWEICQSCAETTKCHAGHTLAPLVRTRTDEESGREGSGHEEVGRGAQLTPLRPLTLSLSAPRTAAEPQLHL